ncbi:hypothetical protein [Rhizobium sullae]|uniref:hypothetical protein n=1 Tax=Rhizobium sullae TaxID=50338 RepID=UPI003CC7C447
MKWLLSAFTGTFTVQAPPNVRRGYLPIDRVLVALAFQKFVRCRVAWLDLICEIVENETTSAGGKCQGGVSFTLRCKVGLRLFLAKSAASPWNVHSLPRATQSELASSGGGTYL